MPTLEHMIVQDIATSASTHSTAFKEILSVQGPLYYTAMRLNIIKSTLTINSLRLSSCNTSLNHMARIMDSETLESSKVRLGCQFPNVLHYMLFHAIAMV